MPSSTAHPHRGPSGAALLAGVGALLLGVGALLLGVGCNEVRDPALEPATDPRFEAPLPEPRSLGFDPLRHVFWGDLHIHTAYSYDAYTLGVRALPDDAYTYAKGGTIQHGAGYPIRAFRALDFAAVTDHAEYLGVARELGADDEDATSLREVLETGSPIRITANFLYTTLVKMRSSETREATFGSAGDEVSRSAWREIVASAERNYEPGSFTSFIAYEWTSMPGEQNLHRNVVYRGSRIPDQPYSSLDSDDPEDLWRALDAQRARGMQVLAIPHNGNVSNGLMYDARSLDGSPLSPDYARDRMRNEPLSEIFQVKGQSETHPILSNEDEFADFEIYDRMLSAKAEPSQPAGSYARHALRRGLEMSARDGFNPYRFGVIGSSDSHNASSEVEENNYHGKLPLLDGTPAVRLGVSLLLPRSQNRALAWGAAGLAAVWAEQNTRESLFDAMRRKETYATSGPRMAVRFFAGFDYEPAMLEAADLVARAYRGGVPMGGTLVASGQGGAPRFLVLASMDPIGARLDRIQIVKGWVDADGDSHEKIYDVAASDGRVADPETHRVAALPSTVDLATASYRNSVGAPQLAALWSDPDFDPAREAFYYARVLEIATPRWSTYDAVALGIEPPEPAILQERAVTSAIWMTKDAR